MSSTPFSLPPLPLLPNPLDALPAAINHLLRAEPWARAQLAPHVNKTLHIVVQPFTIKLSVAPDGSVARATPSATPDTTVTLPSSAIVRLLSGAGRGDEQGGDRRGDDRSDGLMRDMRLEGDADFAHAASMLVRHLRWDVEEDLSTLVGDAAAHRVVASARSANREIRRTHEKVAAGITEYLLEENPQLVRPRAVHVLADGVRKLRDDIARLEKRVDRLPLRAGPRA
ncbi:MAG: ubiquinone biosynthesis accessory factor UbiJ [Burkholderiaceae bacterium]